MDDALIMGSDYYETIEECALVPGCLPMGLGEPSPPLSACQHIASHLVAVGPYTIEPSAPAQFPGQRLFPAFCAAFRTTACQLAILCTAAAASTCSSRL